MDTRAASIKVTWHHNRLFCRRKETRKIFLKACGRAQRTPSGHIRVTARQGLDTPHGTQALLDPSATHNGRLPQVVLGDDARDGGAYDTMRSSKHACTLKARSQCVPGTSKMPIGGIKGKVL
jgi:hypothetical protein